jgi:two-component system sensor histidine kinase YesM
MVSQAETNATLRTLIIFCAILIMLIIIFSVLIGDYITKPIDTLRKYVKKVGKGDFTLKIEKITNDEIGELTNDFNEMVSNLNNITIKKNNLETNFSEEEPNPIED